MTSLLSIRNVAKIFGKTHVLRDISLEVAEGEFLTILGESGSGKTTLLRVIAGFEQATSGELWMGGERLDALPPYKRPVNTVFQHYALFPHLTMGDNVGDGLRIGGVSKGETTTRVNAALAMVNRPKLLLLDEPRSALDANMRRQMQIELKALQREVGIAFVFITHDQEEAMVMSDRIALLKGGRLEQIATPREIYSRPATSYVAQFIGHTNLLRGSVANGIARCGSLTWPVQAADGPTAFSVRPENVRLAVGAGNAAVQFEGRVQHQAFHGATEMVRVECADGLVFLIRMTGAGGAKVGDSLRLEFSPQEAVAVRDAEAA